MEKKENCCTFYGSVHDKKIADESEYQYLDEIRLRQDCGFQGYAPENVTIVMSFKSLETEN